MVVTSAVRDLAGNPLLDFYSEFRMEPAADATAPQVVGVRPPSGATDVSGASSVVLFFSEPMDPVTLEEGAFVSEDGVLVDGTLTMSVSDQAATFAPQEAFGRTAWWRRS